MKDGWPPAAGLPPCLGTVSVAERAGCRLAGEALLGGHFIEGNQRPAAAFGGVLMAALIGQEVPQRSK